MHNRKIKHSDAFKRLAVTKYLSRGRRPVIDVTTELGIAPTMIYEWVNKLCDEDLQLRPHLRSPDSISAQERLKLVLEYEVLSESERGEYLRRQGITSETILQWKQSMAASLGDQQASESDLRIENKRLVKELARKDKALVEAAALLLLQKKVREFYGSEDE